MEQQELYDILKAHLDSHDAIIREMGLYNVGIEIKRRGEVQALIGTHPDDLFIQRHNGPVEPGFPRGLWVRPGAVDRVEVIEGDRKIVRLYGKEKVRTFEVTT